MGDANGYYERITNVDIGEVASQLFGDRITQETHNRLFCDCPNHSSESGKSLIISKDKQLWNCFACNQGGNVLHLIEFFKYGTVSKNLKGLPLPESHILARNDLAEYAGIEPLSFVALSKKEIKKIEEERKLNERVFQVLQDYADTCCSILIHKEEVLEWVMSNYALSKETLLYYRIGYSDTKSNIYKFLQERFKHDFKTLIASGLFKYIEHQDRLVPFFKNRIVFPYWNRGTVVFMAGRKTLWTPDTKYENAKYKKLSVYGKESYKKNIAKCIDNSVLINEDVLISRPKKLIITEGITDCFALMERNFSAISPASVQISEKDWDRLIPKLRNTEQVYICFDSEKSQVGLNGAIKTAEKLSKLNISTKVVRLPLPENSKKIDINQYFLDGASPEDLKKLMTDAKLPIEIAIESLSIKKERQVIQKKVKEILEHIATLPIITGNILLNQLQDKIGKNIMPMTQMRTEVKKLKTKFDRESAKVAKAEEIRKAREQKEKEKEAARVDRIKKENKSKAKDGTCRRYMDDAILEAILEKNTLDEEALEILCRKWLLDHGAKFYKTSEGSPYMYYSQRLFWMDKSDRLKRKTWLALMLELTGLSVKQHTGKVFMDFFELKTIIEGVIKNPSNFIETDTAKNIIYFNLNNERNEIIKISPKKVEIIKNGDNKDGVLLDHSSMILPITFIPDVSIEKSDNLFRKLITNQLACNQNSSFLITNWFNTFLLSGYTGTKPLTRFEGSASSGKTAASKMLSSLLYGSQQQQLTTLAAAYSDGAINPIEFYDNIETKQMTDGFINFLLTSSSGIIKKKRKGNSDKATIVEKANCFVNTTGIDPLSGDIAAILSRSFVFNFDAKYHKNDFDEIETIDEIKKARNYILSGLFLRTAEVLHMIDTGKLKTIKKMIKEELGKHSKERCNEYISLMYLMDITINPDDDLNFLELTYLFAEQIKEQIQNSRKIYIGSSQIANALAVLFRARKIAIKNDIELGKADQNPRYLIDLINKTQADFFDEEGNIIDVFAKDLYIALKNIAKISSITFEYKSIQQFVQRFIGELNILEKCWI